MVIMVIEKHIHHQMMQITNMEGLMQVHYILHMPSNKQKSKKRTINQEKNQLIIIW